MSRRPSVPRGILSIEPSLRRSLYASEGVSLNLRALHPRSRPQQSVHALDGERLGIECTPNPLDQLSMLRMAWVAHRLEEAHIARNSSAILGRARPSSS